MTLEEWRWKYIESYPGKVYSAVALHETLGVVGHYGAVRLPLIYNGERAGGLAICDVMILPPFRGINTLKQMSCITPREAVRDGIIVGYGFPNRNTLLRPAVQLGIYEIVEDVMEAVKEVAFHTEMSRYQYKLFPMDYSDVRIDRLWNECNAELSLAVIRDRRYLNWRYKKHPFFRYELWGLRKRLGSKLQALVVLRREEGRTRIIDFVCPKSMLGVLFLKIENYSFSAGSSQLVLWFPEYLKNRMIGMGFSVRTSVTSVPRTTHEGTLAKSDIAGQFFYTMGDTDFF